MYKILKFTFWEFLVLKHIGLLGKKVKIVLDMQAHFQEKIRFFKRFSENLILPINNILINNQYYKNIF